jgi:hypothetical protein
MEFVFDITRRRVAGGPTQGWQVRLLDGDTGRDFLDPATGKRLLPTPRQVGIVDANSVANPFGLFPVPPQADIDKIPAAEKTSQTSLYAQYCAPANPSVLSNAYGTIIAGWGKTSGGIDAVAFGRYLFTTLMGTYTETANGNTGLWADIWRVAGTSSVLLTLRAHSEDTAINRLPWEMMHAGPRGRQEGSHAGFLAQQPRVSITRQVSDATTSFPKEFRSPPSVLFVVGLKRTDQGLIIDEAIRPGAEYIGLVRGVEQEGLALKTHLLLEATPDSLGQAVANLHPSIVHFTCHGDYEMEKGIQTGTLLLVSNDGKSTVKVSAGALLPKLEGVPIVVLNACNTANQIAEHLPQATQAGQVAVPLAVELIKGGIPIVLGMAGQVADDACRLFTRRFYEALLLGGNLAQAAAEGRRVGIIGQGSINTETSADWGFPVLFTSSGVKGGQIVVTTPSDEEKNWLSSARQFAKWQDQKEAHPFCDRVDYFRWYNILMSEPRVQVTLSPDRQEIGVLAVYVSEVNNKEGMWGRTRLLYNMAAEAARNGHLPWLITNDAVMTPDATTDATMLQTLFRASEASAQTLGIDLFPTWNQLMVLDTSGTPVPPEASPGVRLAILREKYAPPDSPSGVAQAFWEDVVEYLGQLRSAFPWFTGKLLILIDDVHLMSKSATDLLGAMLEKGRSLLRKDVRLVFTYAGAGNTASTSGTPSGSSRAKRLEAIVGVGVKSCELSAFGKPHEECLAYMQYLYGWRQNGLARPLTINRASKAVDSFFKRMSQDVAGIPGYLGSKGNDIVRIFDDLGIEGVSNPFKLADYEAELQNMGVNPNGP